MKKIIVISDNIQLVESFKEILKKLQIQNIFHYFSTNRISNEIEPINVREEALKILKYDLLISLHCQQLIPFEIHSKIKCFNFHPGYNPVNRGWYPQTFCILNGGKYGATIHEIDNTIDGGKIIGQIETVIEPYYTSKEAYEINRIAELQLIEKNIELILNDTYFSKSLEEKGNYNSKNDFHELLELDLSKKTTLGEAIDLLRSLSFEGYDNAYYKTLDGSKIFVDIKLRKE